MERSCAAGGSSNGQPREESGDGSVQIQGFGKLIRSLGTCHPELARPCAGKCQLRPIPAQSYQPSQGFNPSELAPRQPPAPSSPADRERAGCCAPSLCLSLPPGCWAAGTGRGQPSPPQGAKASGSEGAERTARCSQAQPAPEPPPLGAWHCHSRL